MCVLTSKCTKMRLAADLHRNSLRKLAVRPLDELKEETKGEEGDKRTKRGREDWKMMRERGVRDSGVTRESEAPRQIFKWGPPFFVIIFIIHTMNSTWHKSKFKFKLKVIGVCCCNAATKHMVWIVMPTFYCNYYFLLGTRGPLTLGGPLDFAYPAYTPLLRHWWGRWKDELLLRHAYYWHSALYTDVSVHMPNTARRATVLLWLSACSSIAHLYGTKTAHVGTDAAVYSV